MVALPRRLTLAVSLVLLLTGCSGRPIQLPDPATDTPLLERDGPLRTVRMNAGRALTYVQPETAAQILCQAVDRHRLDRLLDDQVSLRPERPPEAACTLGGARVALRLSLQPADTPFAPTATIAGRPAMPLPDNAGEVGVRVALTDDLPTLRPASPARPLLDVTVVHGPALDPTARRELAIRLAIEAVPLLTLAGDPLPDIDPTGRIPYTESPL
ncbi:hypothetical protein, partial [Actinophytocola sp.]|uniref:hypothetical protein n=1 Tax=Actinophytocola sp. TaxID=1872138 RepID=UPI002D7F8A17